MIVYVLYWHDMRPAGTEFPQWSAERESALKFMEGSQIFILKYYKGCTKVYIVHRMSVPNEDKFLIVEAHHK